MFFLSLKIRYNLRLQFRDLFTLLCIEEGLNENPTTGEHFESNIIIYQQSYFWTPYPKLSNATTYSIVFISGSSL